MASFQSWWSLQLVNYLRFGVIVGSLSEILDGLSKLKGLNLGALDSLLKKKHENYWPQTKIKKEESRSNIWFKIAIYYTSNIVKEMKNNMTKKFSARNLTIDSDTSKIVKSDF